MKKVILAVDGRHFPRGAFELIEKMNQVNPVFVTGVFLPVVELTEILYSLGGMTGPLYIPEVQAEDDKLMHESIDRFRAGCERCNIPYAVHEYPVGRITSELKTESRFADLLLISSELFYSNLSEYSHKDYIETAAHRAECPVLLVPESLNMPKSIILAYDGSASSVYAIKQFACLFPELTDLKTILVYASLKNEMPEEENIKELVMHHFKNATFFRLEADPRHYFETWLLDNKDAMLVAGAFARTFLSDLIKRSFVNETIQEHKIPVFTAHR